MPDRADDRQARARRWSRFRSRAISAVHARAADISLQPRSVHAGRRDGQPTGTRASRVTRADAYLGVRAAGRGVMLPAAPPPAVLRGPGCPQGHSRVGTARGTARPARRSRPRSRHDGAVSPQVGRASEHRLAQTPPVEPMSESNDRMVARCSRGDEAVEVRLPNRHRRCEEQPPHDDEREHRPELLQQPDQRERRPARTAITMSA